MADANCIGIDFDLRRHHQRSACSALRLMFPPLTHTTRSAGGPDLRRNDASGPPSRLAGPWPIAVVTLLWLIYQFRKRR